MRKNDISEIRDMLDSMANISTTKLVEEGKIGRASCRERV